MNDTKKKSVIWLVIIILIIVLCVTISTYAYFVAREIYNGEFEVDVTSKGVDTLDIRASNDIRFFATYANFSQEYGHDLKASASVEVNLNTTKQESTYCYEVNFILPDEKVFNYSKPGVAELLLDIEKEIDGKKESVISNMDITTQTGVIKVPIAKDNAEYKNTITALKNTTKSDKWIATLTLVYFKDVDQRINDNKNYKSTLKVNIVEC